MIARIAMSSWAGGPGQTAESSYQILRKLLERGGRSARFDVHDHVDRARLESETMPIRPVCFPYPAPEAVPYIRLPQLLRGGDPDPGMAERVVGGENNDEAGELLAPFLVNLEKIGAFRNPFPLR